MRKESLIVSRNGAEWRWRLPASQVGARLHTGGIFVKGASRVIVVECEYEVSEPWFMSEFRRSDGLVRSTSLF